MQCKMNKVKSQFCGHRIRKAVFITQREHKGSGISVTESLTKQMMKWRLHLLQKYAHIGLKQNLLRSTALHIITRLLDNAAFVCVHMVGSFLKISRKWVGWEVEGFSFRLNGWQQYSARNYEKKCKRSAESRWRRKLIDCGRFRFHEARTSSNH